MAYDILIKGGTVIDGTGLPGFPADIGVSDGRIAAIGDLSGEAADEIIDADGHVVAPGFVDGHTHMDAQIFWDHIGRNSCWHGVTSVVMGNCGFTLAPCAADEKDLVLHNFERAEDIPPEAMNAGIPWSWTSFTEYMDALDALPKGMNYAGYVGHSALRTHVMGKRAMEETATPEDMEAMKESLREAMQAGALGLSTSRTQAHRTPEGMPVASRLSSWEEFCELVDVLRELDCGIVQMARENIIQDPVKRADEHARVKALALKSGRPFTFGSSWSKRNQPDVWRDQFKMVDETNAEGGKMLIQATATWNGSLRSFETMTPYDYIPVWKEFRELPLEEQEAGLRDPEMRKKLVDAVNAHTHKPDPALPNAFQRAVDWDWVFPLTQPLPPHPSLADIAKERGVEPIDAFIDLALENHLKIFFVQPSNNEDQDFVLALIRHPHSVVTFSDSGAHVATTINPIHGHLLGHWVRDKNALTLEAAIRKITFDLASFWGLKERGWLHEGYHADIVIFDPDTIAPSMPTLLHDLPAGAPRIDQKATGIMATIVNGQVFIRDNEHTGAHPGQLLRGEMAQN
ncbi:MAG: amidohydrolase family protein [Rhodospirillales bacterium]|jgi:N-acyl-D-aspartate/D-glutamate deacylase|nr:amidohydrolase family protein [Rhodospirillales bacterium]MBT4005661.1 amidohydrolase family protein [Rhodospirillales bacterium]MBT5113316.1 amidohydrolase family protein [Rhodospirillales bacterium]MBT5672142.1 amidohydrolase family protein [Rhodospirillales bacterium]MBT6187095.1 amidohydrolase family protein [Rhodospirillales bacterium]